MAMFLPLSIVEAEIIPSDKSDLWRARGFSSVHPLYSLRGSVSKNAITMFMSEVLYRTVRDGVYEDGLYEWCRSSILTLDSLESGYSNWHLIFLLDLCGALGFAPSMDSLAPFVGDQYSEFQALLSSRRPEALLLPLRGSQRSRMAQSILDFISFHTESRIDIQSLRVLSELFAE